MQAGSGHIRPGPVPVAVASAPSAASCRMLRSLKSPWVRPWVVPKARRPPESCLPGAASRVNSSELS